MLCDYPGGPTVLLVSSIANSTPIDLVICGHKGTLQFTRDGFTVTAQELVRSEPGIGELKSATYRKTCGEDVRLHHRNLHGAIRKDEALKCDHMLGFYGVVVTMMGVESFRKRKYLKWNAQKEGVEEA